MLGDVAGPPLTARVPRSRVAIPVTAALALLLLATAPPLEPSPRAVAAVRGPAPLRHPAPLRPAGLLRLEVVGPGLAAPSDPLAAAPAGLPVTFSVGTGERVVALTFDLDMSPSMQADLRRGIVRSWIDRDALAQLQAGQIAATLFMTGLWAETYPALARDLARSGQFEIGNHSYSHPAFHLPCYGLGSRSPAGLVSEVERAQAAIRAITGAAPVYFRFPGGCLDPAAVAMVRAHGLTPIQWSLNSIDAFNHSAAQIAGTVISRVQPGDIIVMHLMGGPNAPASGAALRQIIPALRAKGFRFVTVGELLGYGPALQPAGFNGTVQAPACRWRQDRSQRWVCV